MKLSKFSAIGLSVLILALAGCKDIDKPYERISGTNDSVATPQELVLDEDGMSSSSIALFWDGKDAVNQGALSFTVQLTKTEDGAGDNYSSNAKTLMAKDDAGNINEACSFSKLTKGDLFYVRIRANYAYSVYSKWEYLKRNGVIVQVSVGNGLVISEFVEPQDYKATAKNYSSIIVSWSLIGPADGYQVEYKKTIDSEWTIADDDCVDASFTIKGLEPETSYDVRVKAYQIDAETLEKTWTEYATQESITTPIKPDFDPNISDADQLVRFFSEIAAQSGEGEVYTLNNDIDLTGYALDTPETFVGTFDGQGHSLKNWTSAGAPLFLANSGTIKNLILDKSCTLTPIPGHFGFIVADNAGTVSGCKNNADISYTGDFTEVTYFGAIVGRSTGLVENCSNSGNISFAASSGAGSNSCIGGVVGQFESTSGTVAVSGCSNSGNITLTNAATIKNMYVGGVVGSSTLNKKGVAPARGLSDYGIVKGCTNSGEVSNSWSVNASGSYSNTGGVAGYIEGSIEDCTNSGRVYIGCNENPAASSTRPALGGVAGYVTISATNCINNGEVAAKGVWAAGTEGNLGCGGDEQPLFGGCFGGVGDDNQKASPKGGISKCTNNGKVNLEVCQKTGGKTQSCFGGVVGYTTVPVSDSHNTAELNIGLWHKTARVGGVVGWSYAASMEKCTNSGALTFDCNSASLASDATNYFSYQDYVGGIFGVLNAATTVTDCSNSGKITYKGGVTTAVLNYVGGLLGSYSGAQTFTNCKNSGDIEVDSPEALEVGGMAGGFNGTMTGSEQSGNISVKQCVGASGKEPEIGLIAGYVNATFTDCKALGSLKVEAGGTTTIGGIAGGGYSAASGASEWSGCTVDPTSFEGTGSVTLASLLGRYRSDKGTYTLYYNNFTFGNAVNSLPLLGTNAGSKVIEGTKPSE